MPTPRTRVHKHFRLNAAEIKRAQTTAFVGRRNQLRRDAGQGRADPITDSTAS